MSLLWFRNHHFHFAHSILATLLPDVSLINVCACDDTLILRLPASIRKY
ncbi:hypothetical protein OESDEN_14481 [Oesophagostomum dentatum]|uniref:Uncharacterized protein n=1 Tax=Oesophagostomum dentatum TaxID=61180 RepID=A0A0B1SLH0_OESDE|nr:hypothetical protein OESDEN_14481 [Oesophagostomum dentatum]